MLKTFKFDDKNLNVFIADNVTWFYATDICKILGCRYWDLKNYIRLENRRNLNDLTGEDMHGSNRVYVNETGLRHFINISLIGFKFNYELAEGFGKYINFVVADPESKIREVNTLQSQLELERAENHRLRLELEKKNVENCKLRSDLEKKNVENCELRSDLEKKNVENCELRSGDVENHKIHLDLKKKNAEICILQSKLKKERIKNCDLYMGLRKELMADKLDKSFMRECVRDYQLHNTIPDRSIGWTSFQLFLNTRLGINKNEFKTSKRRYLFETVAKEMGIKYSMRRK
jgi:hypothetical protein